MSYDPEELAVGTEVETEHTSDLDEAERIAKDHLDEDPRYYTKLVAMEEGLREPPAGFTLWPGAWTDGTVLESEGRGLKAGFYHVTTRGMSVAEKGLLSRRQVGRAVLGGGALDEAPDMVSFHLHRDSAEWMRDVFVFMSRVCRGQVSAAECVEAVFDWTRFPDGFLEPWEGDEGEEWDDFGEGEGVSPDDVVDLVQNVIGLEVAVDPYDREGFRQALADQAENLDALYPTPQSKFDLIVNLEGRLLSTFWESFEDETCRPFIGFTAGFKAFCSLDPDDIAIVRAAVRKGAKEWLVPDECEIRVRPEDVVVVGVVTAGGRVLANKRGMKANERRGVPLCASFPTPMAAIQMQRAVNATIESTEARVQERPGRGFLVTCHSFRMGVSEWEKLARAYGATSTQCPPTKRMKKNEGEKKRPGASDPDFKAMIARLKARNAEYLRIVSETFDREDIYVTATKRGTRASLTKSTRPGVKYQVTIWSDDTPTGHLDMSSFEEAVKSLHSFDTETLREIEEKGTADVGWRFERNPFVSDAQRRACFAKQDPKWDCHAWAHEKPRRPRR
jgi:hypothetical protein